MKKRTFYIRQRQSDHGYHGECGAGCNYINSKKNGIVNLGDMLQYRITEESLLVFNKKCYLSKRRKN